MVKRSARKTVRCKLPKTEDRDGGDGNVNRAQKRPKVEVKDEQNGEEETNGTAVTRTCTDAATTNQNHQNRNRNRNPPLPATMSLAGVDRNVSGAPPEKEDRKVKKEGNAPLPRRSLTRPSSSASEEKFEQSKPSLPSNFKRFTRSSSEEEEEEEEDNFTNRPLPLSSSSPIYPHTQLPSSSSRPPKQTESSITRRSNNRRSTTAIGDPDRDSFEWHKENPSSTISYEGSDDDNVNHGSTVSKPPSKASRQQKRKGYSSMSMAEQEDRLIIDKPCPKKVPYYNYSYAFCCQTCRCDDKIIAKYGINGNDFSSGNSGNKDLWHKGCCHKIFKPDSNALSPIQQAIETSLCASTDNPRELSIAAIQRIFRRAQEEEKKYEGEHYEPESCSILYSSCRYEDAIQPFHKRPKQKGWRILNLFSGIGSEIVVLKRLGVLMETVVHVEHDPVAIFVNQYHHKECDDGIHHIYVEKFEDIIHEKDLWKLISDHGPFDIVLAGAPDYCKYTRMMYESYVSTNAIIMLVSLSLSYLYTRLCYIVTYMYMMGKASAKSQKDQYVVLVGELVDKIKQIQSSEVIFLSENMVYRNQTLRTEIEQSYGGIPPVNIDAKFFSPCKRNGLYWTNLPVCEVPGGESEEYLMSTASDVLDSDKKYLIPEDVISLHSRDVMDERIVKANTFLASHDKLDDDRMMKLEEKKPGTYVKCTFSTEERERMLGLPDGYVSKPLKELFETLTQKAFLKPEVNDGAKWKDSLDKSYWHFSKKCSFKFKPLPLCPKNAPTSSNPFPFFDLELSAPQENKQTPVYFNQAGYGKHLLGNGSSIPVIEHLLKPLKDKCSVTKEYDNFDYVYQWEPYLERARQIRLVEEVEV